MGGDSFLFCGYFLQIFFAKISPRVEGIKEMLRVSNAGWGNGAISLYDSNKFRVNDSFFRLKLGQFGKLLIHNIRLPAYAWRM